MFNFLKARFNSGRVNDLKDKADASFVTGLILIVVALIAVGFSIEVGKNVYVKQERDAATQDAALSATTSVDSRGSLTEAAINKFLAEYEYQRYGKRKYAFSTVNGIQNTTESEQTANAKVFNEAGTNGVCSTDENGVPYPKYTFVFKENRNSQTGVKYQGSRDEYSIAVNGPASGGPFRSDVKYKVLEVQVEDAVPNLILPIFGNNCQKFTSYASATTFASNADFEDTNDVPTPPGCHRVFTKSGGLDYVCGGNNPGGSLTNDTQTGSSSSNGSSNGSTGTTTQPGNPSGTGNQTATQTPPVGTTPDGQVCRKVANGGVKCTKLPKIP